MWLDSNAEFLPTSQQCAESPDNGTEIAARPGYPHGMARSTYVSAALLVCAVVGATAAEPKRVLVLRSFGDDFEAEDTFADYLRMDLAEKSPYQLDQYELMLEIARFSDGERDELELVGVVEDGRAMIEAAEELRPDVIVADITMPNLNGFEAFARLRNSQPKIKVVFLTLHQNAAYAHRALEAGASAFVVKHAAPEELVLAIHAALNGKTFITPSLTKQVVDESRAAHAPRPKASSRSRHAREKFYNCLRRGVRRRRLQAILRFPHKQSSSTSTK
jgi:DNA-binding NarL/FixJ family response regulator